MEHPKLWWFVRDEDGAFRFVLKTYGELLDNNWYLNPYTAVIVHPDNPFYPEKFREHNKKYEEAIHHYHASRLTRLVKIEAPEAVIGYEANGGLFAYHCHILTEWEEATSTNEEEKNGGNSGVVL